MYRLESWNKEKVEGTFNEQELQSICVDDSTEYFIQDILKRRFQNKQKEVLVRWLHWPQKYDSWIPEDDVKDYS